MRLLLAAFVFAFALAGQVLPLGSIPVASVGQLTGSLSYPLGTENLTTVGVSDWAHWGLTTNSSFDHKATGGTQISNFTVVGASPVTQYSNNQSAFTWTDGTPTASATKSATGVFVNSGGAANGFTFTAPADTTTRVLTVSLAVFASNCKMVAHLSDSSATDYTDMTLSSAAGTELDGLYTFTYKAAAASQTLTITWTVVTVVGGTGNIDLNSATLAPPSTPLISLDSSMPTGLGVTSGTSPWTWSFTNAAGTVLYMWVDVNLTGSTVSATYNGVAMTALGNEPNGSGPGTIYMFRLTSPATGANNFVITWSGGAATAIAGAMSFRGNNVTPDSGTASVSQGTGLTLSVSVAGTTSGNLVLMSGCYGDGANSPQDQTGILTYRLQVNSSSFCNNQAGQYQTATGGTNTASITNPTTSTSWAAIAIELKH